MRKATFYFEGELESLYYEIMRENNELRDKVHILSDIIKNMDLQIIYLTNMKLNPPDYPMNRGFMH